MVSRVIILLSYTMDHEMRGDFVVAIPVEHATTQIQVV